MDRLLEIAERIRRCARCRLHETRRLAVPGEGRAEKGVMIVGEAPGEKEDEEGRPFVGPAGKLLTAILARHGVDRGRDVFITNVVKCRPPGNREPLEDEIAACTPYLVEQIAAVRPRLIIALGVHSARTLMGLAGRKIAKIADVRGKCFEVRIGAVDTTLCVTYHPAAALYNPKLRGALEEDLARFIGGGGGLLKYM
ncbi:MAG: type-4 uracil-DNA glycosylase [Thermoproteus sp.]|uniref:type-4 uracil-DNA glycosylase n=1 Tax=Thermoproteus sp. CP80 TaxID=1650659 RepID=UPI000748D14C|nr:type-4 uracil-DNA glycosylase [Thermoproteus sp. CP80]KUO83944.1 MAG: DNA polymerase [Thermoproteus sp. CIS_19]MDT7869633.1 type-4 uracil-DNA glycosylase [Thermoproteus sp.]MDT7881403.1 type-4 uracil-DNA glycosylase [Thermoproteus sp.]PLC67150.1 uracil-DNA glycosylase [Thermoproteus sp. CP80]